MTSLGPPFLLRLTAIVSSLNFDARTGPVPDGRPCKRKAIGNFVCSTRNVPCLAELAGIYCLWIDSRKLEAPQPGLGLTDVPGDGMPEADVIEDRDGFATGRPVV